MRSSGGGSSSSRYKDTRRRVRPHILGYVGEGELALSAWQMAGTGVGWRLFHVDEISEAHSDRRRFPQPFARL
ncbi:hypothetical protein LZK73_07645 [Neorhizobium galegae]|nr:hypothetical protein LZK73_07645 [Neorhizobium galegae]